MKKVVGLLAGLCLCAGCENEIPEPTASVVSAGKFVVDYTAAAGAATRVIHENQPKGVRINSLTYLLYSEEGTLEKRREIPGLDTDGESWPLRRENMSWEQREALKDTLSQGETYHAVFVANIDSAVCGWTGADGQPWSPLRETGTYETVYLQMPFQPFNDRNMFYVFTRDILSTDQGADRENPYNCPVVLRRAVTRTDFWFEKLPDWEEKTEGGDTEISGYPATCLLPEDIKNYFQSDFYAFVLSKYKDELSQPVVDETVEFLDALELYFSGQILIPDFDLELKDKYTKYNVRLYEIEGQIQGEGKFDFLDQINSDMAEGGVLSNFQTHLVNTLLNELEYNTTVRSLFEQSAKRKSGTWATIAYEGQSGVDKYYLSGKAPEAALAESLRMKADTIVMRKSVSYLAFNWVGLADPEKNKISGVSWYPTAEATTPDFSLTPNSSISTGQGVNEKYSVFYRPMNELNLKTDWEKPAKKTTIVCDLKKALPFTVEDAELIATINQLLSDGKIKDYSGSLEKMSLAITYPDISSSDVLEIKEIWEISK